MILKTETAGGSPCEVPNGNRACNDKLLACEDELRSPKQTNKMDPPELSCQSMSFIVNAFETSLFTDIRRS